MINFDSSKPLIYRHIPLPGIACVMYPYKIIILLLLLLVVQGCTPKSQMEKFADNLIRHDNNNRSFAVIIVDSIHNDNAHTTLVSLIKKYNGAFLEQSTIASADGDEGTILYIIEIEILYLDHILEEVENLGTILKKKAIPNRENYRKIKSEFIQKQIQFSRERENAAVMKVLQDELEDVAQSIEKDLLYLYFFDSIHTTSF
jgi:hypothetical protein